LWDINLLASTNDVVVEITGEAATTINWRVTTQYQVVT
jgi:hypothetical protein